MISRIVSLIALQQLGQARQISSSQAVAPHVYYVQSTKVKKLPYGQTIAEIPVVIRLRHSETRKSGTMQTSLRILLV